MFPHVAGRINRFLDPDSGDNFQIITAMQSFERGGWSGTGPGEGIMKRVLPDSHTDFVFAVVGEEFGILLCLLIVALFTVLVVRGLMQAMRRNDAFERMAIAGLVHADRHPGLHQHGREPAYPAGQGHDASLHLLWRIGAPLVGRSRWASCWRFRAATPTPA